MSRYSNWTHLYFPQRNFFDENVLPFPKLHANVGAHLRFEILLLPSNLLNPSTGGESIVDPLFDDANPTTFGARNHELQAQPEEDASDTSFRADLLALLYRSTSGSPPNPASTPVPSVILHGSSLSTCTPVASIAGESAFDDSAVRIFTPPGSPVPMQLGCPIPAASPPAPVPVEST